MKYPDVGSPDVNRIVLAGMWRHVAWHQQFTREIKSATIAPDLRHARLYDRL